MRVKPINILKVLWLLLPVAAFGQVQMPGQCQGYRINGGEVVFDCDNGFKAMLKLCGNEVLKVWIDPEGTFLRSNPSFAVVNEQLADHLNVNLQETPQGYEVYTEKLIVRIGKNPFRIAVFDKYQKLLLDDFGNQGFEKQGNMLTSRKTLRRGENFYGLGEKSGPLNRRGRTYKMWNSDKPCYGVDEDPLYKSIPFFMSSMGYGLFFDNTYKTEFDFGAASPNYFSFSAPDGEMVYYFIYGPDYKQMVHRYVQLTGNPILPPQWGLGFSQCRGMLTNEPLTREIAAEYRARQIPCDIIYQDIGWTQYLQDFEWRKGNYADAKLMLHDLAEQGFKVVVSQDPVVSQANEKQWREADSLGYFTLDVRTGKSYDMPWPWGGNCGVVDFTKPEVADWWGQYQQKPVNDGVKGFWTDMGEPAWSNEESTDRLLMRHHAGMHDEIHNVYGLTWDKVVTEQFEKHNPNTRIFQMTRAAYAGLQRYTFGWSGDSGNGNNVLDGWAQLENQLPLALSAGLGIIPFWSCDISGYCGDITDYKAMAELYVRWMQFGVFNPLSRAHHEGNVAVEPWLFGTEAERICKLAIERKYRLFPYLYSYAHEARKLGYPIMRAMAFEYPNDPKTADIDTQFMFGSELLVAPVTEQGATQKSVYLPQGDWVDFNDGKTLYHGKRWIDYPVTLEVTPIFVKRGSIVPSMPVVQYIGQYPDYPLVLNVFPANVGSGAVFELTEDDGVTNGYKQNVLGTRRFECKSLNGEFRFTVQNRVQNGYGMEPRALVCSFHLSAKPKSVLMDGKKLKKKALDLTNLKQSAQVRDLAWSWDGERGVCTVLFPMATHVGDLVVRQ